MNIKYYVGLMALFSCAGSAMAQTSVDRSFTADSDDCSSVHWSEKSLQMYPTIGSACQSVQTREGKRYVKFSGVMKKNEGGKRITVDFKDGGEIVLAPPPETTLYVDGRKTTIAQLRKGDELNFYIAEDRLAAQIPETETQLTHMTIVPIVAQAAPAEDTSSMTAALPHTASPTPMFLLAGFAAFALAGALRLFRVRR